jgi:hypothetical protein
MTPAPVDGKVSDIERAVIDAFREGYMVGNEIDLQEYETRVAFAEAKASRYYDLRRDRLEAVRAALRQTPQARDAARYRWLRSREWAVYALEYGCPCGIEYRDQPEDTLDATIDAQLTEMKT